MITSHTPSDSPEKSVRYISSRRPSPTVTFREAVLGGLAPDGGLYRPSSVPRLGAPEFEAMVGSTFPAVAFRVLRPWLADEISEETFGKIVESAFDFPVPLRSLLEPSGKASRVLELFHGPSLAFKDFGARFMAHLLPHLREGEERPLTILTATSGDTGAAVALGFHGVKGVQVVILYPRGRVSPLQEKQLTALGGNVKTYRVEGNFDDCQRMVKQAFLDPDLAASHRLTTANSINLARLLPQMTYYFWAWSRLSDEQRRSEVVFSVPSGNFGNLCAGLLSRRMGLPARFVAAVNVNDSVARHLASGVFRPRPSVATFSSAMDVSRPSNWERVLSLYHEDWDALRRDVQAFSFDDKQTLDVIRRLERNGYRIDPHGAVSFLGLCSEWQRCGDDALTGISLATAHPAKFPEVYRAAGLDAPPLPRPLAQLVAHTRQAIPLPAQFAALKDRLSGGPSPT